MLGLRGSSMPKFMATNFPAQLLFSFLAAVIFIAATFFFGSYFCKQVWFLVSWPAQFAKSYHHGQFQLLVCETFFRSRRQGMLHLTSFMFILLTWWPLFFLGIRYGFKARW
jgi:hypothetical protein